MAITYQTPYGALNTTGTGPTGLYPAYPAGTVAGDVTVIVVGQKPSTANGGTLTTPAGFDIIGSLTGANDGNTGGYGTTLGADTGNMNIWVLAEVATTSKSGTIDLVMSQANSAWCYVMRLSNNTGLWDLAAATGKDTAAGNLSVTFDSNPGVTANDFIIAAFAQPTDVTTPAQFTVGAFTQTGVTFGTVTEEAELDNAGGNDSGGLILRAPVSSGTGSAAPVMTATAGGTTTNVRGPAVFLRLREVAGDTVAPTLTSPTATVTGATTATGTVSTDEANGTLYWLATANATESVATVKAGSSQAVSATGTQNVSVSGLSAGTAYYLHYVHTDAAANDSARVASAQFTTLANVSQSASGSYAAQATVSQPASGSYATQAAVSQSAAGSYAAYTSVSQPASGSYTAYTAVSQSASGSYAAQAAVSQSASGSYAAQSTVTQAASGSYATQETVTASASGTYVASATTNQVRYIRDRLNGSLGNGASYFVEIQAYNSADVNVAQGATVTANFVPGEGTLAQITNGTTTTGDYCSSFDADSVVTVDLGSVMDISGVRRWHYFGDGRTFYNTRTETSVDGLVWTVIFDSFVSGTYAETSDGKYDVTLPNATVLDDRQIGMMIPAYTPTAGVWTAYTDTADTTPSWAVFNPANGPGTVYDATYGGYATAFRAAGGKIVAYTSTSYAGSLNTARTPAAVKADVDTYISLYGSQIDGFFLDEVTTLDSAGNLAYYAEVRDYIKSKSPQYFIVGNAGNYVKEAYIAQDLLDHVVLFEQTGTNFESYVPPAWVGRYDRHRFSYLIHTATQAQAEAAVDKARADNVQYLFVTDDVMANPWDVAPTYWAALNTKAEGPDAPTVTVWPAPVNGYVGATATFTATAVGAATLTYQWQLDSGAGWGDVSGATSSSYTTPTISAGMTGNRYRVRVTNGEGVTTSLSAKLTVVSAVSQSATGTYESLAIELVTATVAGTYATQATVTQPASGSYVTLSAVTQPATGTYAARSTVSQPGSGSYIARSTVTQTGSGSYIARATVSQPGSGSYAAQATVSQAGSGSYIARFTVSQPASGSYSALNAVTQPASGSYSALSAVTQPASGTYSALSAVTQPASGAYASQATVTQSGSGTYGTQATVTQSASGTYTTEAVGQVFATASGTYATQATVSQTGSGSYAAYSAVFQSASGTYVARSSVAQSASGTYAAQATVSQAGSGSYAAYSAVSQTGSGSYTSYSTVSQTASGSYGTIAGVVAAATGTYETQAVGQVVASSSGAYAARALVLQPAAGSYAAQAGVSQASSGSYTALSAVAQAAAGSYAAQAAVSQVGSGSYSALSSVQQSQAGSYESQAVGQVVAASSGSYLSRATVVCTGDGSYASASSLSAAANGAYLTLVTALQSSAGSYVAYSLVESAKAGAYSTREMLSVVGDGAYSTLEVLLGSTTGSYATHQQAAQPAAGSYESYGRLISELLGSYTVEPAPPNFGTIEIADTRFLAASGGRSFRPAEQSRSLQPDVPARSMIAGVGKI